MQYFVAYYNFCHDFPDINQLRRPVNCNFTVYEKAAMIKSWAHKGLKRFFYTGCTSGIQSKHSPKLQEQLAFLNAATRVEDMNRPGYAFHRLSGKLSNYYAITVSGGWRLIFAFKHGNALLVDYLNYH